MPEDRTRTPADQEAPEAKAPEVRQPVEGDELLDHWDDILGPRPESIEKRLIRDLGIPHTGSLTICRSSGEPIVSIAPNGKITYGEGYTPDEAAETFWTSMALKRANMEERLQQLSIMEAMLVRLGRADFRYERAQLASRQEGADVNSVITTERCRMNLEAIVHQIIEYSRGVATLHAQASPEPLTATPPDLVAPTLRSTPQSVLRASMGPADPNCSTCQGRGTVLGDCSDSPNVWFDRCPVCFPVDREATPP